MSRTYSLRTTSTTRVGRRGLLAGVAATAALAAAAQVPRAATAASQATPQASPAAGGEPSAEALASIVQFTHPQKHFFYLPGFEDEALHAAVYGLDVDTYRRILARFDANARRAAEELLADPAFADRVDRLPFAPGTTIIGLGESDMDDLQSWLEILRHLLDLRRPEDGITVVNQGISGQGTDEALGRLVGFIVGQQPGWIICALGGNDAVRFGRQATKTRISIAETAKNLNELHHLAAAQIAAEWVWVTRWTIDEERIAAFPPFQQAQFALRSEDFAAVNDAVRNQGGLVVDLEPVFGRPPAPEFLIDDGLHPSLAGHQAIAKALVERLTA